MDMGVGGRGGARRRTRRRTSRQVSAAQAAAQPAPTQQPAAQQYDPKDPKSLLEMLAVLHSEGVLNDEEYAAKKMIVVDRI